MRNDDRQDRAEIDAAGARIAQGLTGLIPATVVNRILDGSSPILALREYRGLTVAELAQSYLTEIERGVKRGGVETLRRVAECLGVPMDLIVAVPARD